ncbi:MAG: septum formation initiator family protein [Megasphaera sp.]|nr:septum formation initiator family protein [Megasphaera sp.]MCI1247502.1 septum formation initiator family protein [Megasphaera sp.]
MRQTERRKPDVRGRRKLRNKKKTTWTKYRICILFILIFGGLFLSTKLYQLWEIHQDMRQTLQQEQELTEENERLKARKDQAGDPGEIAQKAREEFGLAKPGEILYKR